jgi:hypothetical protein
MRGWKSWPVLAIGSMVLGACTSEEEGGSGSRQQDAASATSESVEDAANTEEAGSLETTQTSAQRDTGEATDTGVTTEADAAPDSGAGASTDADTATEAAEPDSGEALFCDLPESAPPSCEACLTDSCRDEYEACHCDPTCAVELQTVRDCFDAKHSFDEPSEDLAGDWADCEREAEGEDGELSDQYEALIGCAGASYVPLEEFAEDDPYNRTDGDDNCTAPCFEAWAFDF